MRSGKRKNPSKLRAEAAGYTIPFDEWQEQIRDWAEMPPGDRENHLLLRNSQAIIEGREDFLHQALPHLYSYLPADADLNVAVLIAPCFLASDAASHAS